MFVFCTPVQDNKYTEIYFLLEKNSCLNFLSNIHTIFFGLNYNYQAYGKLFLTTGTDIDNVSDMYKCLEGASQYGAFEALE